MNRESLSRFVYLLLGVACIVNGLWLLTNPVLQKQGAAWLLAGSALLWCSANTHIRPQVHPALALFFSLLAALESLELLAAHTPVQHWIIDAPLTFLLPLVLVVMMLPTPRLPQRGERGIVKWFDAKKGFGFIVRENGEEIFVHYRSIRGAGHRALKDGQAVRFRIGHGDKGLQAEEVVPG